MLKLRINPIVAKDLKNIRGYMVEDNEEYAAKTIQEICGKFENLMYGSEYGLKYSSTPGVGTEVEIRIP